MDNVLIIKIDKAAWWKRVVWSFFPVFQHEVPTTDGLLLQNYRVVFGRLKCCRAIYLRVDKNTKQYKSLMNEYKVEQAMASALHSPEGGNA